MEAREVPEASGPGSSENFREPDDGRQRFLLELEFVQLLANPTYIHYLAQNRYFEDPAFVSYLDYLQYWSRPEYAKFVMYPHSLFFLELLQSSQFRAAMAHPGPKELAHRQQFYLWRHYRNNRLKRLQEQAQPAAPQLEGAEGGQGGQGGEKEPPSKTATPPLRLTRGNGTVEPDTGGRQAAAMGAPSESKKRKAMV